MYVSSVHHDAIVWEVRTEFDDIQFRSISHANALSRAKFTPYISDTAPLVCINLPEPCAAYFSSLVAKL